MDSEESYQTFIFWELKFKKIELWSVVSEVYYSKNDAYTCTFIFNYHQIGAHLLPSIKGTFKERYIHIHTNV